MSVTAAVTATLIVTVTVTATITVLQQLKPQLSQEMKKSASTPTNLHQGQIIVRRNAPNWPAMVGNYGSLGNTSRKQKENLAVNSSSLWLQSRQLKRNCENSKSLSDLSTKEKFASKTYLLRQCQHCQLLYTHYHQCSVVSEMSETFTTKTKDSLTRSEQS